MKYLITSCFIFFVSFSGLAQSQVIHVYVALCDNNRLNHFSRSERAFVYGIDLFVGREWYCWEKRIIFELFAGLGYRIRERYYTTHTSEVTQDSYWGLFQFPSSTNSPASVGTFHVTQGYPTIVMGFRMGFSFSKIY